MPVVVDTAIRIRWQFNSGRTGGRRRVGVNRPCSHAVSILVPTKIAEKEFKKPRTGLVDRRCDDIFSAEKTMAVLP